MLPRLVASSTSSAVRIDFLPAESSGEVPVLGDDDIIADGGTEVMRRVPQAPITKPMLELAPNDREEEQQQPIERTQRFDRASLFSGSTPVAPMMMGIYPPRDVTMQLPAVRYAPEAKPPLAIVAAIGGVLLLCTAMFVTIAVRSSLAHETSTNETSTVVAAPGEARTSPVPEANGIPVVSPDALPSAPYAPHASAGAKTRARSSR